MRILFLTRRYHPYLGGVETHVKAVSEELNKAGFDITIVTQQFNTIEPLREKCGNIEILRIPLQYNENKIKTWQWIGKNNKIFEHADIIHSHDIFWWILPIFIFNIKKMFTTFHGWEGIYPIPLKNKVQRFVYALLSRKTIHIGAWIQEFYFDKPDLVLYGGTYIDEKKIIKNKNKTKTKTKTLSIAFIGRLSADNDIHLYLTVLEYLKEKNIVFTITWIGDGELKNECEKFGVVTGMVTDYASIVQETDLVFASSYLSMLQAQAIGKPIVALYSHYLKQRYLETYPIKDNLIITNGITEAAEFILSNKLTTAKDHDMSNNLKNYTWKSVANKYLQLWSNQ